jgi:hypothetical protein
MLQEGRQRHAERLGELADGGGAAAKLLKHRAPRRIGERMEDIIERGGLIRHMPN